MALSADQQQVADQFMVFMKDPTQSEMVIEGYPGCGKSYLTKYLIDAIRAQNTLTQLISPGQAEIAIHCTATTNKAAAVLADLSGQEAGTVHSLLGLKVSNNFSDGTTSLKRTGKCDVIQDAVIFIDEGSYANSLLMKFVREGTMKCKVVYIGDRYQLATVGETECPVFTTIPNKGVLTGSQRFKASGPIAQLAAKYRACIDADAVLGSFPTVVADGVEIFHHDGPSFEQEVSKTFSTLAMPADAAKVIAWSNGTVREYNHYIRSLHTPDPAFKVGEHVVTNQPIMNKTAGRQITLPTETVAEVTSITPGKEHDVPGWWIVLDNEIKAFQPESHTQVESWIKTLAKQARAKEIGWDKFFEVKEFFADLRPVYSSTVYKAQGSTYKKVFINLTDIGRCTQAATVARMLLVAFTRSSGTVHLYGRLPDRYGGMVQ